MGGGGGGGEERGRDSGRGGRKGGHSGEKERKWRNERDVGEVKRVRHEQGVGSRISRKGEQAKKRAGVRMERGEEKICREEERVDET